MTADGIYTLSISVPSGCTWDVFTYYTRSITVLTDKGLGAGTIQYRATLPVDFAEIWVTTSSGRYSVVVTSDL